MRPVGLYGRNPALIPAGLRDLTYYAAGPLPRPPARVAVPAVADWGMDENDKLGCCGVAGLDHGEKAVASILGLKDVTFPTAGQIGQYYLAYTKGKDTGVALSQFLRYVQSQPGGMFSETVDAFAPVKVQDIPTLQFTINAYGFAYVGITVTQGMEAAFQYHQPWTLETLLSPVMGGHCIVLVGYDSDYLYGITWGGVIKIPYSTWHYIGDEAWAVIPGYVTQVGNDGRGISYDALKADLAKLAA